MNRTIIINWKWDFDNGDREESEVDMMNRGIVRWDADNDDDQSLEEVLDQEFVFDPALDQNGDKILKVNIDLEALVPSKQEKLRKVIASKLLARLKPDSTHQCLFLFHDKPEHTNKQANFKNANSRFVTFGGGEIKRVYGPGAFLSGASTEYYSNKFGRSIATWKPELSCFWVSRSSFNHVWNHNWHRILYKINRLRELVYFSQLPGYAEEEKLEAREMAADAVATFDSQKKLAYKRESIASANGVFEEYNQFSDELDLYLGNKSSEFIAELDAFAASQPIDYTALNSYLYQLIAKWNNAIYSV